MNYTFNLLFVSGSSFNSAAVDKQLLRDEILDSREPAPSVGAIL